MASFGNHRRELAVLDTSSSPRIPSIQHNPPSAVQAPSNQIAPWLSPAGREGNPQPGFGTSFYDDSGDPPSNSQIPPGSRAGLAGEHQMEEYYDHERRPSAASVNTASSTGSRSSRSGNQHSKKLQTFFGEEYPGSDISNINLAAQGQETPRETPQGKEARSQSFARGQRERNLSSATDTTQRDASPVPSRPRTPVPSSDVVPFLYQDSQVSNLFIKTYLYRGQGGDAHPDCADHYN